MHAYTQIKYNSNYECLYNVYQEVIKYKKKLMLVVIESNCHKGRGNDRYYCLMHRNLQQNGSRDNS